MAISLLKDDNGNPVQDARRVIWAATGIKKAATAVGMGELDISALNIAGNRNAQGEIILRVSAPLQALFFSLGAAATAPSDTSTMLFLPIGGVMVVRARSTDVSLYHIRSSADGTVEAAALV